ncbi:MAG: acetamidase/formamidase family protein [Anaerolineae bacterium]
MEHRLNPTEQTVHDVFSRDLPPVLTIDSGDTVIFKTLEAAGYAFDNPTPFQMPPKFREGYFTENHTMSGPVAIRGAMPGMTLEVRLNQIVPGKWGRTNSGGYPSDINDRLGISDIERYRLWWEIDHDTNTALSSGGHRVPLRPFMGNLGMPPNEPGQHSTHPPRYCGGNLDCKELVAGSRLYLPVSVEGALFSIGDGHGIQGDGETAGPALECPMEIVNVSFHLHPEMHLTMPRAWTPAGWVTFGFNADLNIAWMDAVEGMVGLMHELYDFGKAEALNLLSLVVDLRITQVVNGVRGVHAILPHDMIEKVGM